MDLRSTKRKEPPMGDPGAAGEAATPAQADAAARQLFMSPQVPRQRRRWGRVNIAAVTVPAATAAIAAIAGRRAAAAIAAALWATATARAGCAGRRGAQHLGDGAYGGLLARLSAALHIQEDLDILLVLLLTDDGAHDAVLHPENANAQQLLLDQLDQHRLVLGVSAVGATDQDELRQRSASLQAQGGGGESGVVAVRTLCSCVWPTGPRAGIQATPARVATHGAASEVQRCADMRAWECTRLAVVQGLERVLA